VDETFPKSVAVLKAELKRLESELRAADAAGDRRRALNTLANMLQLQKRFMQQWSRQSPGHAEQSDSDPAHPPGSGSGSGTSR
jgi:hypothetical protein